MIFSLFFGSSLYFLIILSNFSFEIVLSPRESLINLLISKCLSSVSLTFTLYFLSLVGALLFNPVEIAQVDVRQSVMIDVGKATIDKLAAANDVAIEAADGM